MPTLIPENILVVAGETIERFRECVRTAITGDAEYEKFIEETREMIRNTINNRPPPPQLVEWGHVDYAPRITWNDIREAERFSGFPLAEVGQEFQGELPPISWETRFIEGDWRLPRSSVPHSQEEQEERLRVKDRAKELFIESLTDEQKEEAESGKIQVIGSVSGDTYTIKLREAALGFAGNITRRKSNQKAHYVERYCILPVYQHTYPCWDVFLAQKLVIEADEELFLATAYTESSGYTGLYTSA